ncbi:MAG: hypothetical protein ABSA05_02890 [Opitutaceae bacterium]|jgi:hypothetical protein
MPIEPLSESAIARWLALGVTSRTHPVLRSAYREFFEPLGIEAAWLEAEPFSALESGYGGWWLREAWWNPARIDRGHPAAVDFEFLLAEAGRFEVGVGSQGALSIRPASEQTWVAVRHGIRAGQDAEAFIHLAAGLLVLGDRAAELFAAGNDDAFCALVRARLAETPPDAATETAGREACRPDHKDADPKSPR